MKSDNRQKMYSVTQARYESHTGKEEYRIGLPENLKIGIESLSGLAMDDVTVHYNSFKPAQIQAHAYTQGTDIYIAPGQEKHLPHEAWHVVQQKQGRVKPTIRINGVYINDDARLEKEADVMGAKALQFVDNQPETVVQMKWTTIATGYPFQQQSPIRKKEKRSNIIQRRGVNAGASSNGLRAQYNILLNSATFTKLDGIVTENRDIILVDSSLIADRPVDYDAATHTIRVPLNDAGGGARPFPEVREDILWEMHNASIQGAIGRTNKKFNVNPPGQGASIDEREKYGYQAAAYALCIEWEEWANIAEHDIKAEKINQELGAGGPHVTRSYRNVYVTPDRGWFLFSNYLKFQIDNNHTTSYDANADWKGKELLKIVEKTSSVYLKITQQQVNDFISGKTKRMKNFSNNPFMSEKLINIARDHR